MHFNNHYLETLGYYSYDLQIFTLRPRPYLA